MKYEVKIPKKDNEELAYICGLMLGDGSLPEAYSKRPNGKYQKRYIIHFFSKHSYFTKEVYKPI